MRAWWSKILCIPRRASLDLDLSAELRAHRDLLIEANLASGMTPDQARNAAAGQLGNETILGEQAREAWQFPPLETFLQDLRYALRSLRHAPGFALLVILTLALGLGANTAIFSVVHAVLLRPLPYPHAERLVRLGESTRKAQGISVTWINFQHWRSENRVFEELAGFSTSTPTLTGHGDAILTHAASLTGPFFDITGWQPLSGRPFSTADDRPGAPPTAIVSAEFWNRALGADPHAVGSTLALDGKSYQLIGILRPGLNFFGRPMDIYLPLGPSAGNTANRSAHGSMRVLGLLKPGVTLAEARADLDSILQRLALADPGPEDDHRAFAQDAATYSTEGVRRPLYLLSAAAGLVLLIACANVASLLLMRGTARARELAIRAAIGAGRTRLARQLLTENLVLAILGGLAGILLAQLCVQAILQRAPLSIPRLAEATLDSTVVAFAALLTLLVGLAAALAPVFAASRADLTADLKEGASGSGMGGSSQRLRNSLTVAEIALTLVLAFASSLLLRSLIAAQTIHPGFDPSHLLALELKLPSSKYNLTQTRQFYTALLQDLRSEPGIESASTVACPPSAGDCGDWWYSIQGRPDPVRGEVPLTLFNTADSAYFRTMRLPLLAGREFSSADREGAPPVAIVNRELAGKWWSSPQQALHQRLKFGGPFMAGGVYEIVGVAGNVSQMGLDAQPFPEIYFPFEQEPSSAMVLMLRTSGEPARWTSTVRRRVAALDRNVPIQSLRPFEAALGASLDRRRFSTLLLAIFTSLAFVMAAVGIYGVLNYWIGIRRQEIALRLALGAHPREILRWAGLHIVRLALSGIVAGALGCWAASRWLASLLFGVSIHDPALILSAVAAVITLASFAAALPLWRATRVDAVIALKATA